MKHISTQSGLHEFEIRPPILLQEFRNLCVEESKLFFANPEKIQEVNCTICGGSTSTKAFEKHGFDYKKCASCESLFVSPRPTFASLQEFHAESKASRFRVEHLAGGTASARHRHLISTNANWMSRIVDECIGHQGGSYTDIETTLPSLFNEILNLRIFDTVNALRPECSVTDLLQTGSVNILDKLPSQQISVSSFEKLERQHSPTEYLDSAAKMLADDGILFLSTRTSTGFDIQVLWEHTPYIFVPEHLNLPSLEGFERLVDQVGLEVVELSTPGQLDLEFVANAVNNHPEIPIPNWLTFLLKKCGEESHSDFQLFLQKHRLSSHLRAALRKKQ